MMRSGWSGYETKFVDEERVERYNRQYDEGSYDDHVWRLERPVLLDVLRSERARRGCLRVLDFACGTGRILRGLAGVADELTGVDISAEMAKHAAEASPEALIRTGCVLTENLLAGPYDAVTVFRFLLNAPEEVRVPVLRKIRQHMEPGALLILNNHGHCPSLRSIAVRVPKSRPERPNELRHRDIIELLHASGFRVESRRGFSAFPPVLHRNLPAAALRRADAVACRPPLQRITGGLMVEQLYMARAVR
ncbi:class I SAM-dependent methyltransferase [Streptomyces sp. MNU76]|uniref:class I SAM-dependent DNA methyltransferase n=1 Tax=Streptomyces sp. MNU76 TaxID=2560026 RepID=UPI001E4E0D63|nr:class I SAM-dependent methyltransferase [Streptomyces sp. MNU76]MCC9704410.1 class I SAM-dependent methyltransferase [Streptomyces sp. MNU76]